jgi:hypothetical protein
MRHRLLAALLPLALASGACSGVGQGAADYDSVAKATRDCQADGGELKLRPNYDGRELSSYDCIGARK